MNDSSAPTRLIRALRVRITIIVVVSLGLTLTLLQTGKSWLEEQAVLQNVLARHANDRVVTLNRDIAQALATVDSLSSSYDSSDEITATGFHQFSETLANRHTFPHQLGWVSRVPHAQREAFEEKNQSEYMPDFRISEMGPEGNMVPSVSREEYFPFSLLEPHEDNQTLLGFDLASDPARLACLEQARSAGKMVASGRLAPLRKERTGFRFMLCSPVYGEHAHDDSVVETHANEHEHDPRVETHTEALIGYVVSVENMGPLVAAAFEDLSNAGVDYHFFDTSAPTGEQFLHYSASRSRPPSDTITEDESVLQSRLHWGDQG